MLATKEISAFAGRTYAANVSTVVGYYSLSYVPVFYVLADLNDFACKFVSSNRLLLVGCDVGVIITVVYVPVLHISTADCGSLDFKNNIVGSAFGNRIILHHFVATKSRSKSF